MMPLFVYWRGDRPDDGEVSGERREGENLDGQIVYVELNLSPSLFFYEYLTQIEISRGLILDKWGNIHTQMDYLLPSPLSRTTTHYPTHHDDGQPSERRTGI